MLLTSPCLWGVQLRQARNTKHHIVGRQRFRSAVQEKRRGGHSSEQGVGRSQGNSLGATLPEHEGT